MNHPHRPIFEQVSESYAFRSATIYHVVNRTVISWSEWSQAGDVMDQWSQGDPARFGDAVRHALAVEAQPDGVFVQINV